MPLRCCKCLGSRVCCIGWGTSAVGSSRPSEHLRHQLGGRPGAHSRTAQSRPRKRDQTPHRSFTKAAIHAGRSIFGDQRSEVRDFPDFQFVQANVEHSAVSRHLRGQPNANDDPVFASVVWRVSTIVQSARDAPVNHRSHRMNSGPFPRPAHCLPNPLASKSLSLCSFLPRLTYQVGHRSGSTEAGSSAPG